MALTINGTTGIETNTDTGKVKIGASDDIQIYHESGSSYITNLTGNTYVKTLGGQFHVRPNGDEEGLIVKPNGNVELYYDNTKVFETLDYGAKIKRPSGGATSLDIVGCEGQDAVLFLAADDGDDNNDQMRLVAGQGSYSLQNYGGGSWETNASFHADAQVELYYNNVKTFETTFEGVRVQADEGASAVLELWADQGDDNSDKWRIVSDQSSNYFYVQNYASGSWESTIRAAGNGSIDLYYDDTKRLETTSTGAKITGNKTKLSNPGGEAELIIGDSASNNQYSFIDFVSDTTYSDYSLRILRGDGGVNSGSAIYHRGTGAFSVVLVDGGTASYPTSSDYRLKDNVVSLSDGITKLKTLKPYRFNYKHTPDVVLDGFFAHEATAVPCAVTGTKDEVMAEDSPLPGGLKKGDPKYQSVDYSKFVPLLTAALQEAITKIETLETEVNTLKTKVAALEAHTHE